MSLKVDVNNCIKGRYILCLVEWFDWEVFRCFWYEIRMWYEENILIL